jgi:hypothetical protein
VLLRLTTSTNAVLMAMRLGQAYRLLLAAEVLLLLKQSLFLQPLGTQCVASVRNVAMHTLLVHLCPFESGQRGEKTKDAGWGGVVQQQVNGHDYVLLFDNVHVGILQNNSISTIRIPKIQANTHARPYPPLTPFLSREVPFPLVLSAPQTRAKRRKQRPPVYNRPYRYCS